MRIIVDMYDSLVRPILTCGSEIWTVTTEEMNAFRIFERNIVRKIRVYGPVQVGKLWKIGNI